MPKGGEQARQVRELQRLMTEAGFPPDEPFAIRKTEELSLGNLVSSWSTLLQDLHVTFVPLPQRTELDLRDDVSIAAEATDEQVRLALAYHYDLITRLESTAEQVEYYKTTPIISLYMRRVLHSSATEKGGLY